LDHERQNQKIYLCIKCLVDVTSRHVFSGEIPWTLRAVTDRGLSASSAVPPIEKPMRIQKTCIPFVRRQFILYINKLRWSSS